MIEVAAAIIESEGKFLVTRRTKRQHLAGYWEFPGGKRRRGESWKRCLARELREELGIRARIGERIALVDHQYPDRTVRIAFYCCTLTASKLHAWEGQEIRWVSRAQLVKLELPAADVEVVRILMGRSTTNCD